MTVNSNTITGAGVTITTAGSGYAPGDLLLMNPLGGGSGVRAVVTSHAGIGGTDTIIVDNVDNNFVSTTDIVHFTQGGTSTTIANSNITSVTPDSIRDGYTLKFDHKNHGMHSSTNKVRVSNFHPDGSPTTLTNNIDDDTTAITLTSGANFTNFEGGAVGVGTSGYLLIDKEIISYNTICLLYTSPSPRDRG